MPRLLGPSVVKQWCGLRFNFRNAIFDGGKV
jgi:hypothetical protein